MVTMRSPICSRRVTEPAAANRSGTTDGASAPGTTSAGHRREDADIDAVYVACSPFGSVEYIEHIERDTGLPVVMSAQAQLWKAFRMGGVSPDPAGRGQLFAETWG